MYNVLKRDGKIANFVMSNFAIRVSYESGFVYFNFNYDFVDNQRFTLPKNYYFYADGVYKYTNKENTVKTVRKVSLISK